MIKVTGIAGFTARFRNSEDNQIIGSFDTLCRDTVFSSASLSNVSTWRYMTGVQSSPADIKLLNSVGINFNKIQGQLSS